MAAVERRFLLAAAVEGIVRAAKVVLATGNVYASRHHFQPAEIHAPANKTLALQVKNLDAVAMEFEGVSLRVEKVVAPGSEGVVYVRPLAPGRYEFFDDFHQQTRGFLVVQ